MARTLSIIVAGAVLLVAAACLVSARKDSLFFDRGTQSASNTGVTG